MHKHKLLMYLLFLILTSINFYLFICEYYRLYQIINVFSTLIFVFCSFEFILFNHVIYKSKIPSAHLNKRFMHSQTFAKGIVMCKNCVYGAGLIVMGSEILYKVCNGPISISPWRQSYLNYKYGTKNIEFNELSLSQATIDKSQGIPVTGRPLNFSYTVDIKGDTKVPVFGSAPHDVSITGEANLGSTHQIKNEE